MAGGELWKNKLRTFLSLFGITIGIFCIVSVLATVGSLEANIKNQIQSLGNNTIYVDKWQYGGGPDYPFWKYVKRPSPAYEEVAEILERTATAKYAAFKIGATTTVEIRGTAASNIRVYGVTEDFGSIQPLNVSSGRFLTGGEFVRGVNVAVIGTTVAQTLFGSDAGAVDKTITARGQQLLIVGVLKKAGSQLIGGWGFDASVIVPYKAARVMMDEKKADPLILVQGKDAVSSKVLQDDLKGTMRAVRRLKPLEADDFSLNDVNDFTDVMTDAFGSINLGGWIIGALAFIVGIFGVANIMFVTVSERTPQIGLKKALGAKRSAILAEFLLESAFLCVLGGLIGLALVFTLAKVATAVLNFPIFLSPGIVATAIGICIAAGIAAGIVPALRAAKMNPVTAIRS